MNEEQVNHTSSPTRVSIQTDVLSQSIEDDETVLLNLKTEHYYGLRGIGPRLWQLIEEHGDTTQMMTQLLLEYDVEEAVLRSDVETMIEKLIEVGLVIEDEKKSV